MIDTYEGYKGLEKAIRDLDSNFTGDLSVVFEKGSATVIIFNDTTDVEGEEEPEDPTGFEIKSFDPYTGDVEVYGADALTPAQVISYLKSKGFTNVKYNSGDDTYNYTTPDGADIENLGVTVTQVFKVSLGTTKTASKDGVTFTITDFKDQYVSAATGYTLTITVTGTQGGSTTLTATVAGTNSATFATATASGSPTNMGTPGTNDGTIKTTTTSGAVSGTYTMVVKPATDDVVVTISVA